MRREGGDQRPPIGAPGQIQNRSGVALESEDGQAGVDGVEHETGIRPRPGDPPAIGAEGQGVGTARRTQIRMDVPSRDPDRAPRSPGVAIPELDAAVPLEAGEGQAVGAEDHVGEPTLVTPECEPIVVKELPEVAPLPAAEAGLARAWPQQVEETAK